MSDAIGPSFGGANRVRPPTVHRDGNDMHRAAGPAFMDMLGGGHVRASSDQHEPVISAPDRLLQVQPHVRDEPGGYDEDVCFDAVLTKADHAVAFDGRPVVGPASVAMPKVELPQSEGTGPEQTGARRLDPLERQLWGGPAQVELSSLLPEGTVASATPPPAGLQKPQPSSRPAQPIPATLALQLAAVLDRTDVNDTMQPESLPHLDPGPVERSGRLQQAIEHQLARGNLLARMIPSDQDYRLLLRGPALEPLQKRSIRRAIGNLIRAFGLPDMPVLISWYRKGK